ncbi:MAG: RNA methyltransferase [Actinomycetota bacterium]|nr:RNA methyltransferase [Actinomycetota bacterium]MDP2288444.1 RNA methyltransferase [Actinomycetota bacterium]
MRESVGSGLLVEVFLTEGFASEFLDVLVDVPLTYVSESVMEALGETRAPQGIVGVCRWTSAAIADAIPGGGPASVLLDGVSDPGNAGTIIRSADAAGAAGVLLTAGSVDPSNGKCVRASAGSIFHLPIATDVQLAELASAIDPSRMLFAVASGDAALDVFDWLGSVPSHQSICWVFGAEAPGVSQEARDLADVQVRIPLYGRAESLNVAAAAAVCLYADAARLHGKLR